MKNGKHKFFCVLLAVIAGLTGRAVQAAATSDILTPMKRAEIVSQAKQLLAVREAPVAANDPFHSLAFAEASGAIVRPVINPADARPASARTAQDLLQAIAANLKPSGNFVLSGQRTLIFGQKRVKAGGTLTITFEGTEYTVEITAIETNNFTLRLNREEFTRPIK